MSSTLTVGQRVRICATPQTETPWVTGSMNGTCGKEGKVTDVNTACSSYHTATVEIDDGPVYVYQQKWLTPLPRFKEGDIVRVSRSVLKHGVTSVRAAAGLAGRVLHVDIQGNLPVYSLGMSETPITSFRETELEPYKPLDVGQEVQLPATRPADYMSGPGWVTEMDALLGMKSVIECQHLSDGAAPDRGFYRYRVCCGRWWCEQWLKPLFKEEPTIVLATAPVSVVQPKPRFHVGQMVRINEDAGVPQLHNTVGWPREMDKTRGQIGRITRLDSWSDTKGYRYDVRILGSPAEWLYEENWLTDQVFDIDQQVQIIDKLPTEEAARMWPTALSDTCGKIGTVTMFVHGVADAPLRYQVRTCVGTYVYYAEWLRDVPEGTKPETSTTKESMQPAEFRFDVGQEVYVVMTATPKDATLFWNSRMGATLGKAGRVKSRSYHSGKARYYVQFTDSHGNPESWTYLEDWLTAVPVPREDTTVCSLDETPKTIPAAAAEENILFRLWRFFMEKQVPVGLALLVGVLCAPVVFTIGGAVGSTTAPKVVIKTSPIKRIVQMEMGKEVTDKDFSPACKKLLDSMDGVDGWRLAKNGFNGVVHEKQGIYVDMQGFVQPQSVKTNEDFPAPFTQEFTRPEQAAISDAVKLLKTKLVTQKLK